MSSRPSVLLVEGDRQFAASLARELTADGYWVDLAHSAPHALIRLQAHTPQIVLLGRLVSRAAVELLAEMHDVEQSSGGRAPAIPVLVLGEEAGGLEALRALDAGADDFMARPVSYLELRARLRAILRRTARSSRWGALEVGGLCVELDARRTRIDRCELQLSRTEFDLLAHLAGAPERVFSRDALLRAVWGYRTPVATRTVDSHASRLRRKLAEGSGERWIIGVRGVGYRLI